VELRSHYFSIRDNKLPDKDEKDDSEIVKASVYMPRGEYVGYRVDAARTLERVSHYLLRLIRIGKAFMDYDLRDFLKVLRGETADREEIEEEIEDLGRNLSLREFYERLLEMKRFCREGRRIIELREDVIDEKLDELEHLLEEEE